MATSSNGSDPGAGTSAASGKGVITGLIILLVLTIIGRLVWNYYQRPVSNAQEKGVFHERAALREERVSVKDFAPDESFRKNVKPTGLDWEVMRGCLTVESVSSVNPRMLETVCEGAPKELRPSAAYIIFRAEAGSATLRMSE